MEFEEEDGAEGEDPKEETGWKLVHGDVFRFPKHVMLFSACVGTGAQVSQRCLTCASAFAALESDVFACVFAYVFACVVHVLCCAVLYCAVCRVLCCRSA